MLYIHNFVHRVVNTASSRSSFPLRLKTATTRARKLRTGSTLHKEHAGASLDVSQLGVPIIVRALSNAKRASAIASNTAVATTMAVRTTTGTTLVTPNKLHTKSHIRIIPQRNVISPLLNLKTKYDNLVKKEHTRLNPKLIITTKQAPLIELVPKIILSPTAAVTQCAIKEKIAFKRPVSSEVSTSGEDQDQEETKHMDEAGEHETLKWDYSQIMQPIKQGCIIVKTKEGRRLC